MHLVSLCMFLLPLGARLHGRGSIIAMGNKKKVEQKNKAGCSQHCHTCTHTHTHKAIATKPSTGEQLIGFTWEMQDLSRKLMDLNTEMYRSQFLLWWNSGEQVLGQLKHSFICKSYSRWTCRHSRGQLAEDRTHPWEPTFFSFFPTRGHFQNY